MAERKESAGEIMVYGLLMLVFFNIGVTAVSTAPMDVAGRDVPPHPALATMAVVGAVAALASSFVFGTRALGAKEGIKHVFGNLGGGILIVSGMSAVVAFFLRAIFGPGMLAILPLIWVAIVYVTVERAGKQGPVW